MSDVADAHRRVADIIEPLEQMGIEVAVDQRATEEGDLCLLLDLRIPRSLDPIDGGATQERVEILEAKCEDLRAARDEARDRVEAVVRQAEDLERRPDAGGDRNEVSAAAVDGDPDAADGETEVAAWADRTEGERSTLRALHELGGPRASEEIAHEVDSTLQSVRSWLPKLVKAGLVRAVADPTDGRRKRYSLVEPDELADDGPADVEGPVYIAYSGGSPSQVFHVREDCPQLQKSAGSVEKDRSVVPNHRPCRNCVPEGLDDGLVAVAKGAQSSIYHNRQDCPKLGSATEVVVTEREAVSNHDPCEDCVHLEEAGDGVDPVGGSRVEDTDDTVEESNVEETDDVDDESSVEETDDPVDDGTAVEETDETVDESSVEETDDVDDESSVEDTDDPVEESAGVDDGEAADDAAGPAELPRAVRICGRNELSREAIVDALDAGTAIYQVQRDLELSREETEALLEDLGVFESFDGGGYVTRATAKSVVREHVPPRNRREYDVAEKSSGVRRGRGP